MITWCNYLCAIYGQWEFLRSLQIWHLKSHKSDLLHIQYLPISQ